MSRDPNGVLTTDNLIASTEKLFPLIKTTKWRAYVAHMVKHMNMVGDLFGMGPGLFGPFSKSDVESMGSALRAKEQNS